MNKKTVDKYNQLMDRVSDKEAITRFKKKLGIGTRSAGFNDALNELVSNIRGTSYAEGYAFGYKEGNFELEVEKEFEEGVEIHRNEEGYCCACGYDLAVFGGKLEETVVKTAEHICDIIDDIELREHGSTLEEWKQYKHIRNRIRDTFVLKENE